MTSSPTSRIPADIPAVLDELGITVLRVTGEEAIAHCAMHAERTGKPDRHPSWSCNTETGAFNCFSCGWSGPFLRLVADLLSLSRDAADDWIRQRGGIIVARRLLERGKSRETPQDDGRVFHVTEADMALFTAPPGPSLTEWGITREACRKYGVLWDEQHSMWITPIRNAGGRLKGWQEKNPRHFRNVPVAVAKSRYLFGGHLLQPGQQVVLLESPLDAVRLASVGVPGAVSSYGAHVSEEQMQFLFGITGSTGRIIIAMDNDTDGKKASQLIKERYPGMGTRLAFYRYRGDEKDPGEQSGADIRYGVDHAFSTLRMRPPCS